MGRQINHEKHPPPEISRVIRSVEEARASYDRLSKWYDVLAGSERHFVDAGLDQLAAADGERLLEIGFGTGYALVRLARAVGPAGTVYGVDVSEGMCSVAGRRIEHAGLSSRIHLTTGNASMLPFSSGCLHAIFMSFTLELFDSPEIPVVLRECARVLNPEGRICVVSMSAEGRPGLALRVYEWAHERFPKVVDCRPIFLRQSLEDAGFGLVAANRGQMWGLPIDICVAAKRPAD